MDGTGEADGARLRQWREARSLSLTRMARLVHYSTGYLSKVENCEKPLTDGVRREYERVLRSPAAGPGPGDGPAPEAAPPAAAGSAATGRPAARPAPEPMCVGREAELGTLVAASQVAAAGAFRVMWVVGEPGAGKSTVAGALARSLSGRGWVTAGSRSSEMPGTPPEWSWTRIVEQVEAPPEAVPAAGELGDRLARAARRGPLLVVLEDVHLDGGGTLQRLRHLFTELSGRPVLVLATYRPQEVTANLGAARAALVGDRSGELVLAGLDEAAVETILREVGGVVPAPEEVALITRRTAGNPLFVSEVARLVRSEGIGAVGAVPPGVGHVLRHRLAGLPEAARAVLRTVAVLGSDADVELLLALGPAPADAVLDGLEAAVTAGLLTETGPDSVRFVHALMRDVVYEDVPRLRRQRLHARVLEHLDGAGRADVTVLAHHALAAATRATVDAAVDLAARAARVATARSSWIEAAGFIERALLALDRGGRPPATAEPELRLDLLCSLVSVQAHAGRRSAARRTRHRAVDLAWSTGRPALLARAHASYDAPAFWAVHGYAHEDPELVASVEKALTVVPQGEVRLRVLLATLAVEADPASATPAGAAAAEALELARALGDPLLVCRALNARFVVAASDPDRHDQLEAIGAEQLERAAAAGLTTFEAQGHHILFMAALARNDLELAAAHVTRAVRYANAERLRPALDLLEAFDALRALVAGRLDEADQRYARIAAQLRAVGDPNASTFDLLTRWCMLRARGGPEMPARLGAMADEVLPYLEALGEPAREPCVWSLATAGRLDEARATWRPDEPARRDYYWMLWTTMRAEIAVMLGDRGVAADCYRQLGPHAGRFPELVHGHVTVRPVDHTLGELAQALGRPDDAAGHYRQALRLSELVGAPHWSREARAALRAVQARSLIR